MRLSLSPECRCTLERAGRIVRLSASELSTLRGCLLDVGTSPEAALPRNLMRELFESGILQPGDAYADSAVSYWREKLPSLALSPYLRLQTQFSTGVDGTHGVEPAIALFVDPAFVESATELSREIRSAVSRAVSASAVRGSTFPRHRVLDLAHEVAWNWLQARPQMARWLNWDRGPEGALSLAVVDYGALTTLASAYPWAVIVASIDGRERRSDRVIAPAETLQHLTRVMDGLRANTLDFPHAELESIHVRRILGTIERVGGFVERGRAPEVFAGQAKEDVALAVTHMGHASLIVDGGGQRVLIDPVLYAWDDAFEKQPLISAQLGRVDAICFTHHHLDHMSPDALVTLPHDLPVFVPAETSQPLEPRTAAFLTLMGFRDVRTLRHGESFTLEGGLTVEAVPFFGEGQDRFRFGANCYLVSRAGRNVLVHADSSPDSGGHSIVSTGYLEKLVGRRGRIEVIFGTWWQERQFVCNLSPLSIFYPGVDPKTWLDAAETCDCPPEFLCDMIRTAGAAKLLLYAESGEECFLPRARMSSYVPALSLLWHPLDEVRQMVVQNTGGTIIQAQPYMTVVLPVVAAPYVEGSKVAASRLPS